MGSGGMLIPLLMISATVALRCVPVRLGCVLVMFGCSGMFVFWHYLTPIGIYPVFRSDESPVGVDAPALQPGLMRPT